MSARYLFLSVSILALVLTACGEPRRTPDGHLMDRPKMSAYGEDETGVSNTSDDNVNEDKK
jgi:hypothetical protein